MKKGTATAAEEAALGALLEAVERIRTACSGNVPPEFAEFLSRRFYTGLIGRDFQIDQLARALVATLPKRRQMAPLLERRKASAEAAAKRRELILTAVDRAIKEFPERPYAYPGNTVQQFYEKISRRTGIPVNAIRKALPGFGKRFKTILKHHRRRASLEAHSANSSSATTRTNRVLSH